MYPRVLHWSLFVGVSGACGPEKAGPDNDTSLTSVDTLTSPTTVTGPETGTSVGGACLEVPTTGEVVTDTGAETGSSDTGGPLACPPVTGQPCTAPIDCADEICGSHVSAFDEHGCPRPPCTNDAECGAGEGCLLQTASSRPLHAVDCAGTPDACSCAATAETLVGVCVAEALLPANFLAHCDTLKTAAACDRFDIGVERYCRWLPFRSLCDGACSVVGDGAGCIGFMQVGDGCIGDCAMDEGPYGSGQGYARPRSGGADLLINPSCGDEPHGWTACLLDGPDSVACCMCSVV